MLSGLNKQSAVAKANSLKPRHCKTHRKETPGDRNQFLDPASPVNFFRGREHPATRDGRDKRLRTLLSEPLVLFMLFGGLLFAADALRHPDLAGKREIVVSGADVERLHQLATAQYGSAPDPARLRELVRAYVREEVLYREAIAGGLDRDDVVLRRRLVQKFEFLAQADVRVPDEQQVMTYYQAHLATYTAPARLAFEQLSFSPARHGSDTDDLAAQALAHLRAGRVDVASDPSMFARTVTSQSQQDVARDFGADFAAALFAQEGNQWAGPLRSAHGLHLVRVTAQQAQQVQPFVEVRERVRADLTNEALKQARDRAYDQARRRYHITLLDSAGKDWQ